MPMQLKIKIKDNSELRMKIDELYVKTNQVDLAKWSLLMAKRILDIVGIDYHSVDEVVNGFKVNELWQISEARMHDVRQAGVKIHKVARESNSEIKKTALRVVGQAVGSGHMREHAIVSFMAHYIRLSIPEIRLNIPAACIGLISIPAQIHC